MSWTYSGDPTASALDEVRFLIGDTDTNEQLLQDGEINYAIAKAVNNLYLAGAYCADSLRARFAKSADSKSVGDLSVSHGSRVKYFSELAAQLRMRATLSTVTVYAGGLSRAEKRAQDEDIDRVQPAAKIDGMNAPSYNDPSSATTVP